MVLLSLNTELKMGSFELKKDPHGKDFTLMKLVFDTVTTSFLQRPDSFKTGISLGTLTVYDGSEYTVYDQIVRVKDDRAFSGAMSVETAGTATEEINVDNPFFYLEFEKNPLDQHADSVLSLKMRHLEIIYNKDAIESVTEFFKPPDQMLESIAALIVSMW
jgi:vacuolar protein sorting-associated protein 13A/C